MRAFTVTEVNGYVKTVFDLDPKLANISVEGEISDFKDHFASRNLFFSLKDRSSSLACVMFASDAAKLSFRPSDGMAVRATGRVSVYPAEGKYQLYVRRMEPCGDGDVMAAFLALKEKLLKEGLFDPERKKPLPAFPERVGVISSASGAALRDICNVLGRRWPLAQIVLCPVNVQGIQAARELTEAVRLFDSSGCADVVIIARGGGSAEDLKAFNDEALARAICACRVPVVSGVGHETDFTICDFAADLRAPTPSAAAELATPDAAKQLRGLDELRRSAGSTLRTRIFAERSRLAELRSRGGFDSAGGLIANERLRVDALTIQLSQSVKLLTSGKRSSLDGAVKALGALSPYSVLDRGYALVTKEGKVVPGVARLDPGDAINIRMRDGSADAVVVKGDRNGCKTDL